MQWLRKNRLELIGKIASLFDRRERMEFAVVMAAAGIAALFQALGVVSVLPFVELVMNPGAIEDNRFLNFAFTSLNFESAYSFTMFAGIALLVVLVAGNAVSAFADWLRIRFVWHKNHALSSALLRAYLFMPYVFFLNRHSADLSKNVLFEVQQLTNRLLMPLLAIATKGVVVVVLLLLLIIMNPAVALAVTAIFGTAYLATFFFLRRGLGERGSLRLAENTWRFTTAEEALSGIKDIKALGREQEFFNRFSRHSDTFARLQSWASTAMHLPRYFMEVVAFGGVIVIILVFLALQRDSAEVIATISFFAFAGYRLMPAVQVVFHASSETQFTMPILDRVVEDLREGAGTPDIRRLDVEGGGLVSPLAFRDRIALQDVRFEYPFAEEPSIFGVNLEIPEGSFVGFVGPTGGGKSTLVDILIGLLVPRGGTISVDGRAISRQNVAQWQKAIGYVPQHIFLTDDTVLRNVAFGLPDEQIDKRRAEQVCKIAQLHDFIVQELSQGYDTLIGERGVRLSGGQRQRLGIARALYHDPAVLVFDEATNALDSATELAVVTSIRDMAKRKTVIVVAHRLATVQNCNAIYFIDQGRVAAQGTYQSLMETHADFRAMVEQGGGADESTRMKRRA